MASLERRHPPGGDTQIKNVAEFTKNSWETRIGHVKKVWGDTLRGVTPEWNSKKRSSVLRGKNRGDTVDLITKKEKKVVSFLRKRKGWHRQLPPRMTPTLVTPLGYRSGSLDSGSGLQTRNRFALTEYRSISTKLRLKPKCGMAMRVWLEVDSNKRLIYEDGDRH